MILVPVDTPGVNILRSTSVFGWQDQHGHAEIVYDNVRVPAANLLAEEGMGSRSPRPGSARAVSTTACARSGLPSAPWP